MFARVFENILSSGSERNENDIFDAEICVDTDEIKPSHVSGSFV